MNNETRELLRGLPKVDEAVNELEATPETNGVPRWALVRAVRDEVDTLRQQIIKDGAGVAELDAGAVMARVKRLLTPSLRPVYNATGVVVHTNLGRAPLSEQVLERMGQVARGYSNLEYDLDGRTRGSRHVHVAELLKELTGAEDAVVVNNNAAAVLLCLSALAQGKEVVVSRGELIEIGGSFRIPDVMAASGALLKEVGTTNRTHPRDYEGAMGEETALLFKAHRSNFAVVGFTKEVEPSELTAIGRRHQIPTYYDLGSGSLIPLEQLGLPGESTVQDAVAQGFDLVSFSGDKLLGGPQAGIIVGRAEYIARLRSHPLMRPLRPDKMTLAGLGLTLEAYRDGEAPARLPVVGMLAASPEDLRRRANRLRRALRGRLDDSYTLGLRPVISRVGGGASPLAEPGSFAVTLEHPEHKADALEGILRGADPPVVARIEEDTLVLDVRTLPDAELAQVAACMAEVLGDALVRSPTRKDA